MKFDVFHIFFLWTALISNSISYLTDKLNKFYEKSSNPWPIIRKTFKLLEFYKFNKNTILGEHGLISQPDWNNFTYPDHVTRNTSLIY